MKGHSAEGNNQTAHEAHQFSLLHSNLESLLSAFVVGDIRRKGCFACLLVTGCNGWEDEQTVPSRTDRECWDLPVRDNYVVALNVPSY